MNASDQAGTRTSSGRPAVSVTATPIWRVRLARDLPRYLLYALACWGLMASVRFAIDPPRPVVSAARGGSLPSRDLAAEGFAALFTRHYLTWEARDPEARSRALAELLGSGGDDGAGLHPPASGEQHVLWAEVVQAREPRAGEHVYTVAAQTDAAGLLYLSVSVMRVARGALALAGYPAFVGAPSTGAFAPGPEVSLTSGQGRDVSDRALVTVVQRALRNYLEASGSELAADLSREGHVSLPGLSLTPLAFQRLRWVAGGDSVDVTVLAEDQRGAQYTLDYELDVTRQGGRWEISAIQMNPYA